MSLPLNGPSVFCDAQLSVVIFYSVNKLVSKQPVTMCAMVSSSQTEMFSVAVRIVVSNAVV